MAEVKNAFIKSKMNKDLDARLIPQGEYRDAKNAQISRSEGDDVGALTNILGNKKLIEFDVTQNSMTSIGYYVDEINNDIYVFLTDNYGSSWIPQSGGGGWHHAIYKYNVKSEVSTKLIEGAFLNFSTQSPIIGVNLLEDILFFTDNRNQPRKINVKIASADSLYYQKEHQVSVAKYNPYEVISLYEQSSLSVNDHETTMKDVVSKFLPDGGTAISTNAVTSASVFAIQDINIPFYPALQTSGVDSLPQNGMRVGVITKASQYQGPITDTGLTVNSYSSPNITLSGNITLALEDQLVFNFNPYYNNDFAGDEDYLEDKFVRFSYRFKFDDGEYSLIAPFTQPCFIPKQDGYFLNTSPDKGDQQLTFNSTIVSFMENKVNEIKLVIPLPDSRNNFVDNFKINSLEIIYKESDQTALRVVESIPASDITSVSSNTYYDYVYSGKQPFKTLPDNEITRVYDKVPVKALSQEIINNRVVYGNFQDKHTPPASLDYNIISTPKSDFNLKTGSAVFVSPSGTVTAGTTITISGATGTIQQGSIATGTGVSANTLVTSTNGSTTIVLDKDMTLTPGRAVDFAPANDIENTTSKIEYPSHSLKTNRNYQVGVVLSDKYGRSSSVILSNNNDIVTVGVDDFKGDSIYSPYEDGTTTPSSWPGNSLKMSFNSVIGPSQPNNSTGWPGLYNDDVTSSDYNPLGWYSFKIVVKQQEQEYYNVYTAGAIKGEIDHNGTVPGTNTSYITLINDNINKVPRDLSEVGPQDKTFRSSVRLFGRVENTVISFSNNGSKQYYPGQRSFTVNAVEDLFDLFTVDQSSHPITSAQQPYHVFFKAESNPFIGEFVTSNVATNQFGIINNASPSFTTINNLTIFETEPVESRLDIYYETSTSGLISELNTAVLNESSAGSDFDGFNTSIFSESLGNNVNILSQNFFIINNFGVNIPPADVTAFTLTSVFTVPESGGTAIDASSYFTLAGNQTSGFNIKTTSSFLDNVYFQSQSDLNEFVFNFESDINNSRTQYSKTATLNNEPPVMTANGVTPAVNYTVTKGLYDVDITTATSVNGANANNKNRGLDIVWNISSQTNSAGENVNNFGIVTEVLQPGTTNNKSQCTVKNLLPGTIVPDTYTINLNTVDAGQSNVSVVVTAKFNVIPTTVTQVEVQIEDSQSNAGGGQDYEIAFYVIIHVEDSTNSAENGYYIYNGSWGGLSSSNSILIDYTNSIKQTSDGCGTWFFNTDSSVVESLWEGCAANSGDEINVSEIQNPDLSNSFFGIV